MSTRPFTNPRSLRQECGGPLGPHIDAYAALLHEQGYSYDAARTQLQVIVHLSRWLKRRNLTASDIGPRTIARYMQDCKRRGHSRRVNRSALRKLVGLLHERGHRAQELPAARPSARRRIEQDFQRYLLQERALSPATLLNYLPFVRALLSACFGAGRVGLHRLRAADITGFVRRHAHRYSPGRAKLMTTALRSFLRYLRLRGEIDRDLAACVPCVPRWSLSGVPKFLAPGQVQQVLEHCERHTPIGMRDYAILLLLARLGLRAGEIVSLTLEDIDWVHGSITLHGKGKRWTQLPLPQEVGQALAQYIRHARPRSGSRRVFLRHYAPRQGFANSSAVCCVVERALVRAGIDSARKGAHLFRHTLATDMLRQGASLSEIGQLLRHRHPSTTSIYAKVDLSALRTLALPWPGDKR